jgi:hypothetical protein
MLQRAKESNFRRALRQSRCVKIKKPTVVARQLLYSTPNRIPIEYFFSKPPQRKEIFIYKANIRKGF